MSDGVLFSIIIIGIGALISFFVTFLMTKIGIRDLPNHRSSHAVVTPTAGGVSVIIVMAALSLPLAFFIDILSMALGGPSRADIIRLFLIVLALLTAMALLGLIDDIKTIPSRFKFLIMILLSALAVWVIGPVQSFPLGATGIALPYIIGFLGSLLWVFVVTNAVNFMDGSNGLMGLVMLIACAGFMVTLAFLTGQGGILFWIPLAIGAGLLGFLPFNLRYKARIFSGDVGSLTVGFGFAIAILDLTQKEDGFSLLFVGPLLILPFLADVLLTMGRRFRRRENLMTPHRSHIYQRLIQSGRSHLFVAWAYGALTCLLALYTLVMVAQGWIDHPLVLIGPVIVLSVIYAGLNRRLN